jgi:hypothetical protein
MAEVFLSPSRQHDVTGAFASYLLVDLPPSRLLTSSRDYQHTWEWLLPLPTTPAGFAGTLSFLSPFLLTLVGPVWNPLLSACYVLRFWSTLHRVASHIKY